MGIVACRGYVGSQLRSAPPCSNPFCTGRGCRFVNVFSYNGFLLPHVRRRHDFLSRFKPYTSFDRNQPSSFLLCLASETWHGFPRDPPSLLLRPCVFLPPGTIQLRNSFFGGGKEGDSRVEPHSPLLVLLAPGRQPTFVRAHEKKPRSRKGVEARPTA